jgi:hypothetical protein
MREVCSHRYFNDSSGYLARPLFGHARRITNAPVILKGSHTLRMNITVAQSAVLIAEGGPEDRRD